MPAHNHIKLQFLQIQHPVLSSVLQWHQPPPIPMSRATLPLQTVSPESERSQSGSIEWWMCVLSLLFSLPLIESKTLATVNVDLPTPVNLIYNYSPTCPESGLLNDSKFSIDKSNHPSSLDVCDVQFKLMLSFREPFSIQSIFYLEFKPNTQSIILKTTCKCR